MGGGGDVLFSASSVPRAGSRGRPSDNNNRVVLTVTVTVNE